MNILFLEDRGSVSFPLVDELRGQRHEVFDAGSVRDARSYWEDKKIDCLIVDLNMDPAGLTDEQANQTHGGLLTGWIWLRDYVFNVRQDMRQRTIIYTDYMEQLRANVPPSDLAGLRLVSKRGLHHVEDGGPPLSPTEQVLSHVEGISRMPRKETHG